MWANSVIYELHCHTFLAKLRSSPPQTPCLPWEHISRVIFCVEQASLSLSWEIHFHPLLCHVFYQINVVIQFVVQFLSALQSSRLTRNVPEKGTVHCLTSDKELMSQNILTGVGRLKNPIKIHKQRRQSRNWNESDTSQLHSRPISPSSLAVMTSGWTLEYEPRTKCTRNRFSAWRTDRPAVEYYK